MTHQKTIENFIEMAERFGGFTMTPDAARQLAYAIKDLQNSNRNLTDRNALLRQRPDLPVDRIPAHRELERLQALEVSVTYGNWVDFDGLNIVTVERLLAHEMDPQRRKILSLAISAMTTYVDEKGGTWVAPTAYAYAKACEALVFYKTRSNEVGRMVEDVKNILRGNKKDD